MPELIHYTYVSWPGKHTFTKECEWVVYIDSYNGLYKSVFCSPLYKERYKEAYGAAAIENLNIPNRVPALQCNTNL